MQPRQLLPLNMKIVFQLYLVDFYCSIHLFKKIRDQKSISAFVWAVLFSALRVLYICEKTELFLYMLLFVASKVVGGKC